MKFDMNEAWRSASTMIRGNAQVLFIVAGVFFFLPSLAMAFFVPPPAVTDDLAGEQAFAAMAGYYEEALPFVLLAAVAQAVGVLALLALLNDHKRPTVGEALKTGASSVLPYIAAQLIVSFGIGIVAIVLAGAIVASGAMVLAALLVPLGLAAAFYVFTKTSLVAPVLVIEGERSPVRAIARSWALTKGNSLRLFGFYALLFVAFLVVMIVVSLIVGLLAAAVLGTGEALTMVDGAVSGALGAVIVVYFVGFIAAAHRQLAGPSPEQVSATFD